MAALDASAKPPSQHRRRWRLQAGAGLVAIMGVSIALVVLMVHSAGASDVRRSAAAAEKAGTFTFVSTSELTFSSGARQTARQTGAVDLNAPGYRLQDQREARTARALNDSSSPVRCSCGASADDIPARGVK